MFSAGKLLFFGSLYAGILLLGGCGGGGGGGDKATGPSWEKAAPLESAAGEALAPVLAVNGSGDAMAVWYQVNGSVTNIFANHFTKGSGWEGAVSLQVDTSKAAEFPTVAMDAAGHAVAVWQEMDDSQFNIWANFYQPGSGWVGATLVETNDAGEAIRPTVAMDRSGNAITVWMQSIGQDTDSRTDIWASRKPFGGNWQPPNLIEVDNTGEANLPKIAMNSDGIAAVVWYQKDANVENIWSNRYVPAQGWKGTSLVEYSATLAAYFPAVAVDPLGNAIAVWEQSDGARSKVWANYYDINTATWGDPEIIENNANSSTSAQVAMDGSGNAIAVWVQSSNIANVAANHFVKGEGWKTETLIEQNNQGDASLPQIAINSTGDATAIWYQNDGSRTNILANHYTVATGWEGEKPVESNNQGRAILPKVGIDNSGLSLSVWAQDVGTGLSIFESSYQP